MPCECRDLPVPNLSHYCSSRSRSRQSLDSTVRSGLSVILNVIVVLLTVGSLVFLYFYISVLSLDIIVTSWDKC